MSQSSTLLHRNLISSFLSQSHNTVSGGLCSLPSQMSSSAALFSSVTTIKSRRPTNSNSLHSTNKLPLLSSPFIDPTSFRPIIHHHIHGRNTTKPTSKHPILLEWQDCTVKKEINVPISVAYNCYLDRESIPRWMPFISSVKILEDNPELSRWTLKYTAFGRDLEFSWLARNMQPIPNQKIHWRSLEGLPNRGAVRFFPKGSSSCLVELTVSYEVPQLLAPVAAALQPFTANLLGRGLERFANFVRTYQTDSV